MGAAATKRPLLKRRGFWILAGLAALAVVVLAVVLPVYFVVVHKHGSTANGGSGGSGTPAGSGPPGSGNGNPASPTGATSGGNGTVVTMANGTQFTYINPFGGYWVYDPKAPFNNNARPNSWTPPLNTSWTWGKDQVFGVNLGGLFVLEPFIVPALYEKYVGAVDEWTLSTLMAADTASGGMSQLENHYDTFITEEDIAQIAGAGLNWIRLPIPFWCIETWSPEPFLARTSWTYIVRLLGWARKYGLRVNLDLHTIPGSQNGYNHSGRQGQVNWLYGVMGIANAERALGYIRTIAEFISQPEWQNVVPMFGIVNEPLVPQIGQDAVGRFYLQAYETIRSITGTGEGNGAYISIHDGFAGLTSWKGFLTGADRMVLDTHPYFAFNGQPNTAPIDTPAGDGGTWPAQACGWASMITQSQTDFGITVGGEFSTAYNDCGLFVDGITATGASGTPTFGGSCALYQDSSTWTPTLKSGLKAFTMASMDALENWFYWTWKIGVSSKTGIVSAPLWSYSLGLAGGWIPTDPRSAVGYCSSIGVANAPFPGTYSAWQTGGTGAGTIAPAAQASYSAYPPPSLSGIAIPADASLLYQYTSTGTPVTLPMPTFTGVKVTDNGWYNTADNGGAATPVAGCAYPDAWAESSLAMPVGSACGAAATGGVVAPTRTPATVPATTTAATATTTATVATTTAATTATATVRRR
ncbi:glycoside hydrolase family 5 protein [Jaapia argillacea MUCL 33604]|uniref:glucan 1,3-beta-glucosidase n=1 Tax=Jaapia argillacea MUCL 33604 TaxID=933084 RepID=A0A067PNW4_9AGAM|nr:glycoside hydrolase family 5 protein [Jaapia argillacea MUCL 33604]